MKIKSKTGLRVFTYEDIKSWGPCYDPKKFIPETWRGTALDILALKDVSPADKTWVVLRTQVTSEKVMRLFAVWCVRETAKYVLESERKKFLDICEVIERFAKGQATNEELSAAESAAWSAAWSAAESAARSAAWSAARSAQLEKLREMLLAEGKERVEKKRMKGSTK